MHALPPPHLSTMSCETPTPEFISARDAAMSEVGDGFAGHDASDPKVPSGHAHGIEVSTRLTSCYRTTHDRRALDITPRQVMDCLRAAEVKDWLLMGLHGYVGYLPMPRATQDVDVMIPYSQKKRATQAIQDSWPTLQVSEVSQVVRFHDPGDLDGDGNPRPVIDIMLPWGEYQATILSQHVVVDDVTGDRIPTIEAAIVLKYAAIISPHRDIENREYDSGDLRRLVKSNYDDIDQAVVEKLANQVWEHGSQDIRRFIERALAGQPFAS
jgi:hypothetical protein